MADDKDIQNNGMPSDENNDINQTEKIVPINLEREMRDSFIDYAMSVIVARALPDVRDGLKPVHRRILFSMDELGLDPTKPHKKSARITGDTMGKYHPHGDAAIYDAMVRMAQSFSMRYPLVDGHGNFGSMDGDGAAAPRYTEARLSRLAGELLADIDKDTVEFVPNYDEEFKEPTVLPSRFPNLIVNGSSGIAVGMATNIPPHNLNETVDAIVKIIDNRVQENRETEIEELTALIQGPDFPTGGTVYGTSGIRQYFHTGRGRVVVRARADIEPMGGGREMIVITEIPYQVNKSKMVEKIGELVKEKKIEGITDLRDESNRTGVRVVIELRKDANSNVILNQLYKYSQMQESFGVIMLTLVNGEPRILNIKQALEYYLEHQKDVITRRTRFELDKALKRAHLLEGYLIALDNIDEVLAIIRSSKDAAEARTRLSERFSLSDEQSSAIVEMRFRSLTGMEKERLELEYAELKETIKELTVILEDEKRLYGVIKEEILIIKAKYGDARRTVITPYDDEIDVEDLIDDELSVITMTHLDYIKRLPLSTYKSQNRGGRGVVGIQMRDEDLIKHMFVANTHDYILFFTNKGRVFRTKAYEIPVAGRTARGMALVNLLSLDGGEKVAAVLEVDEYNDSEYLTMITRNGIFKKTALSEYARVKKTGLKALNIREDDELISVLRTSDAGDIFIATRQGMGIRFSVGGIRPLGRTASGVRSIDLAEGDSVVGAGIFTDGKILLVSEKGYGKCTEKSEFRLQKRNGKGLRIYKLTDKTGDVVGICSVGDRDEVMLINSEGIVIRIRVADISTQSRYAQGVKLINLDEGVNVVSVAKISEEQLETEASALEDDEENGMEGEVDESDISPEIGQTEE